MYKRRVIAYTEAIVSYTDKTGKRHSNKLIRFNGVECYKNFELYKVILEHEASFNMYKPFVHVIKQTFYWEE